MSNNNLAQHTVECVGFFFFTEGKSDLHFLGFSKLGKLLSIGYISMRKTPNTFFVHEYFYNFVLKLENMDVAYSKKMPFSKWSVATILLIFVAKKKFKLQFQTKFEIFPKFLKT